MSDGATISAPSPRVRERLLSKNSERGIISHFAVLDDTAVAVIRVFAEAHVRNHKKFQFCFANCFNRALHHPFFAKGAGPSRVLGFGQTKKYDPRNPQRLHVAALFHNLID